MVVIEAVVRLLPGSDRQSGVFDRGVARRTLRGGMLGGPSYRKPPSWRGLNVPEVLLSGHHERIAAWRRDQAVARTRQRRPELLASSEPVIEPASPDDA